MSETDRLDEFGDRVCPSVALKKSANDNKSNTLKKTSSWPTMRCSFILQQRSLRGEEGELGGDGGKHTFCFRNHWSNAFMMDRDDEGQG